VAESKGFRIVLWGTVFLFVKCTKASIMVVDIGR